MRRRVLAALLGVLFLAGAAEWGLAAEKGDPAVKGGKRKGRKKERKVDPYRSLVSKLSAARRKAILDNPELKKTYDDIRAKEKEIKDQYTALRKQRQELSKQLEEIYKKVSAQTPEIAEMEKQKQQMEEERKVKREEAKRKKAEEKAKKEGAAP